MGDCYSVELRVKLRKSTKSDMQKLLRQWMREKEKDAGGHRALGVNWNLAMYRRLGIRPDSFAGICKILLAFHQGDASHIVDDEGFDVFRSGFNASYGWNSVMVGAFYKMSRALAEGSYLEIDRDEGHEIYEVEDDDDEVEVWENHRPPYHRR